ncbi:MAG TPA: thioredoxin family protein [bacterium]|nr:thioredoxin family protein [bacterium]HQO33236.1 thioredoxin family protein [bacterium]HQP98516.1 thioredoxin family protein [bacterium]
MKHTKTYTIWLAFLFTVLGAQPGAAKKIEQLGMTWYTKLEEGLAVAQKEKRPIFVDFWDIRSTAYKQQFEGTYKDTRIMAMFPKFVRVTLNIRLENQTAGQFRVRQVPEILFLDTDGKELGRHRTSQHVTPEMLQERMESVLGDLEAFAKLKQQVQDEPTNYEAALKMAQTIEGWLQEEDAIPLYEKLSHTEQAGQEIRDLASEGVFRSLLAYGNRLGLHGDSETAIRTLRKALELFPNHERTNEILFMLGQYLIDAEKKDEAIKVFEQLKANSKGEDEKKADAMLRALKGTS